MRVRCFGTALAALTLAALPAVGASAESGSTCGDGTGRTTAEPVGGLGLTAFDVTTTSNGLVFGLEGRWDLTGTYAIIRSDLDRHPAKVPYKISVGNGGTASLTSGTSQQTQLGRLPLATSVDGDRVEVTLPYEVVQDGSIAVSGSTFTDARTVGAVIHELPAVGEVTGASVVLQTPAYQATPDSEPGAQEVQRIELGCEVDWRWEPTTDLGGPAGDVHLTRAAPASTVTLDAGDTLDIEVSGAGLLRAFADTTAPREDALRIVGPDGSRHSFMREVKSYTGVLGIYSTNGSSATVPNAGGSTYTLSVPAGWTYGPVTFDLGFQHTNG